MKAVNHLNLQRLQLQNAVVHPLGSAPSTPVEGQMYYDTGLDAPRWWDGGAWINKATDSLLLGGSSLATVVARASHTGTQTAATISDLAAVVQAYRLDQFAAPTAAVSLNNQRITNLADPSAGGDAVNRSYLETQLINAAAGIDAKPSVRAASTANVNLAAPGAAIDGVTLSSGDRVLLKNQSTASQNGVYVWTGSGAALTRAVDANASAEMTPGAFWYVEEGTTNGATQWRLENTGAIVLDTTSLTINQFGGAGTSYVAGNGLDLTGNSFSVEVVASGGITVGGSGIQVDAAIVARKYSTLIGDGASATLTVTHNLNTKDVIVSVREVATDEVVLANVIAATVNTVTVGFATAPASNAYRATVMG